MTEHVVHCHRMVGRLVATGEMVLCPRPMGHDGPCKVSNAQEHLDVVVSQPVTPRPRVAYVPGEVAVVLAFADPPTGQFDGDGERL